MAGIQVVRAPLLGAALPYCQGTVMSKMLYVPAFLTSTWYAMCAKCRQRVGTLMGAAVHHCLQFSAVNFSALWPHTSQCIQDHPHLTAMHPPPNLWKASKKLVEGFESIADAQCVCPG